MTAQIQRGNAADMKTETDVVKLGADFFRAMPKMAFTLPLNNTDDMACIIGLIPKDSMTYSLIKMTNQSMLAGFNNHMALDFQKDFQGDVSAFSFERGSDRRINLDISDVNKPKVTVSQTYDYKTNPASETPDFSVSTSLSVQHDLGTGQVGSSVEFKSIHTPTANASLKAVQDHFKALGAKEVGLVEHLKGMSIESQLITLKSEYANPAQKEAVKAALTELVQYHIDQGTGQEFTSAAIISQVNSEMAVPNFVSTTLLRGNSIATLAFVTFANAVGRECLGPIKDKMDAIGKDDSINIMQDLGLDEKNQKVLKTATEVFDIVANLDSKMPDSLKAVLRDLIQAAGVHGKGVFAGILFLRALNPIIAPSQGDIGQTKEAKTDISAVLITTVNSFSEGRSVVVKQESRQYLETLAKSMTIKIDALYTRLEEWTSPPPPLSLPPNGGPELSKKES